MAEVIDDPAYGTDLAGLTDIDLRCTIETGLNVLAADLVNRLEDRLWYDDDYGYPLFMELNDLSNNTGRIANRVESELQKDERVAEVSCTVTPTDAEGVWNVSITVVPVTVATTNVIGAGRVTKRRLGNAFALIGLLKDLKFDDLRLDKGTS